MKLSKTKSIELNAIKNLVHCKYPVEAIHQLSAQLSHHTEIHNFSFFYSGILLAKYGRIGDAISMLLSLDDCVLSKALVCYLKKHNTFVHSVKLFQDPSHYQIFIHSNYYQQLLANAKKIYQIFNNSYMKRHDEIVVLDIGVGDGYFLKMILNDLFKMPQIKKIKLILVDSSSEMIKKAILELEKIKYPKIEIIDFCGKIEELILGDSLKRIAPVHFINASASLHHLEYTQKHKVISILKSISDTLILTEFNTSLEWQLDDSPELIYSVYLHYLPSFIDINSSDIPSDDKKIWMEEYNIPELINIVSNPRNNRGEFFLSIPEWCELVTQSGFGSIQISECIFYRKKSSAFTMLARSNYE